jgi:hypothetical protein
METNNPPGGDGLGNPHENKLPVCQMRFLQSVVDGLYSEDGQNPAPHFWWCDTLCIPIYGEHRAYRTAAIRKMRQIYQEATKVVAVDATLLPISRNANILELYIRIKMSSWARRLWTLQEAIVATDIHIQFADGTRTLQDLASSMKQEGLRNDQYLYTRYSFLANTFFSPFIQANIQDRYQRFMSLWKQLQWRATSHEGDEPVCLAATLGIDPGPILDIPAEQPAERMAKLYQLQKTIPYVALVQPPPRLELDGYRWAPATLLNCFRQQATNPFHIIPGVGEISPDGVGLVIQSSGFTIATDVDRAIPLTGEDFHITDGQERGSLVVSYHRFLRQPGTPDLDSGKTVHSPAIICLRATASLNELAVLADVVDQGPVIMKARFVTIVTLQPGLEDYTRTNQQGNHAFRITGYEAHQAWLLL